MASRIMSVVAQRIVICSVLVLALSGCGARTGVVSGHVFCKDQLVTSGTVTFIGPDNMPYQGAIENDGYYEINAVPVGECRIIVASPDPNPLPEQTADLRNKPPRSPGSFVEPAVDHSKWIPLDEKYSDPKRSGLVTTVRRGKNTFDIRIP